MMENYLLIRLSIRIVHLLKLHQATHDGANANFSRCSFISILTALLPNTLGFFNYKMVIFNVYTYKVAQKK